MTSLQLVALLVGMDAAVWLPVYLWERRQGWDVPLSMIAANVSAIGLNVAIFVVVVIVKGAATS